MANSLTRFESILRRFKADSRSMVRNTGHLPGILTASLLIKPDKQLDAARHAMMKEIFENYQTVIKIHEILLSDVLETVRLYEVSLKSSLYLRICFKEYFTMIDADIAMLNQLSEYDGFSHYAPWEERFKSTFKHHAKFTNGEEPYREYASKHYGELKQLQEVRNNITHPKNLSHVELSDHDLIRRLNISLEHYNKMLNKLLMSL